MIDDQTIPLTGPRLSHSYLIDGQSNRDSNKWEAMNKICSTIKGINYPGRLILDDKAAIRKRCLFSNKMMTL